MTRTPTPIYRELASLIQARINCQQTAKSKWECIHEESIDIIVREFLPSGSGIDCGTKLDLEKSHAEKLVFEVSFHHMNDGGYYDGWTEHTVIITPSLASGFDIRVTGRDRNDIKDYLAEVYHHALSANVWQSEDCVWHCDLYEAMPTV